MPELPEVETTRRGIEQHVLGARITHATVRERRLRWPVTPGLARKLAGRRVEKLERRGKYLLLHLDRGCLLCHLGMSGSLRILDAARPARTAEAHEHIDIVFAHGKILCFRDPRRFGAVLWTSRDPLHHKLLAGLGPEPLGRGFTGEYLHRRAAGRSIAVRNFIMNSRIVAGVGNIYANESLFIAGIHPARRTGRISGRRYDMLADAIRKVLKQAIRKGGTTLKDFVREDGSPGYFKLSLTVYQRENQPCLSCKTPVRRRTLGQRSAFYCPRCQT